MKELFGMFFSFLKIGMFTFGGGYAMIPIIRHEVIEKQHWIDDDQFVELLTLAQSAPAPYRSIRRSSSDTKCAGMPVPSPPCSASCCHPS